MALKLRPTGLGSGIDKDRPDYAIYCGELGVGRIYETRGGPDHPAHGMERHEGALRDAEVFRLHGGQEHGAGRIAGTGAPPPWLLSAGSRRTAACARPPARLGRT